MTTHTTTHTNPLPTGAAPPDIGAPLLEAAAPEPASVQLGFVAGTVPEERLPAFERLLFRATRGNMHLKVMLLWMNRAARGVDDTGMLWIAGRIAD